MSQAFHFSAMGLDSAASGRNDWLGSNAKLYNDRIGSAMLQHYRVMNNHDVINLIIYNIQMIVQQIATQSIKCIIQYLHHCDE
jgi:hypothetical protein